MPSIVTVTKPQTKAVLNSKRIIILGGIFGRLLLHEKNKWEKCSHVADEEQYKHNFLWRGRGGRQAAEMIKKIDDLKAGRFTSTVITAPGLEMGPRGAENTL